MHALLLVVAVVASYASAIPGDFVWLDHRLIEQGGYRLVETGDWSRLFTHSLDGYLDRRWQPAGVSGGYWRPVLALGLSADWLLFGARAWCYHLENLLWHGAVVLGLYALGRRLVGQPGPAFWAALLFAVHPLGTQSVAWISGRNDLMCAAFGIASLLAFGRLVDSDRQGLPWRRSAPWLAASILAMLLSVGSKELGLVVPAAALIVLASGTALRTGKWRGGAASASGLAALFACALGAGLHRVLWLGGIGSGAHYPAGSFAAGVALSASLGWHYVGAVLLPRLPSISDSFPVPQSVGLLHGVALAAALAAGGGLVLGIRRRWIVTPGLLWFAVWLSPALGILPLRHVWAERYLYPASWGLLLAVCLLAGRLTAAGRFRGGRGWGLGAATAVAAGLALTTAWANTLWWNDSALFRSAVARDPAYVEGLVALGRMALESGDPPAALEHLQRAEAAAEDASHARYAPRFVRDTNLGLALFHHRRYREAQGAFQRAHAAKPYHPVAAYHLGLVALASGRFEEARGHLERAHGLDPDDFLTRSNLASALLELGRMQQAAALLDPLVGEDPADAGNLGNLVAALLGLESFEEAETRGKQLVSLRPGDPEAWAKLAWARFGAGDGEGAGRAWRRARVAGPGSRLVRHVGSLLDGPGASPQTGEAAPGGSGGPERAGIRVAWSRAIPDGLRALDASGGRVFTIEGRGDGAQLRALDGATGGLLWSTAVSLPASSRPELFSAGQGVYLALGQPDREGPVTQLSAYDPGDGARIFRREVPSHADQVSASPRLQRVAPGGHVLHGLDPEDGADRWRLEAHSIHSLLGAEGTLLVGADRELIAADSGTGRVRWRRDFGSEALVSGAVVFEPGTRRVLCLIDGDPRRLEAFALDSGTRVWSTAIGDAFDRLGRRGPHVVAFSSRSLEPGILGVDARRGEVSAIPVEGPADPSPPAASPVVLASLISAPDEKSGASFLPCELHGFDAVRWAPVWRQPALCRSRGERTRLLPAEAGAVLGLSGPPQAARPGLWDARGGSLLGALADRAAAPQLAPVRSAGLWILPTRNAEGELGLTALAAESNGPPGADSAQRRRRPPAPSPTSPTPRSSSVPGSGIGIE